MIHIITSGTSPRLHYVLDFIFREVYETDYHIITPDEAKFLDSGLVILYSNYIFEHSLNIPVIQIPCHDLLFEKGIILQNPEVKYDPAKGLPYAFEVPDVKDTSLPFDIFAFVFYLLSRYEEYFPHKKDKYQRFPAELSLAVRNTFIETPVVDIWLTVFIKMVCEKALLTVRKKQCYDIYPTIDVDAVWAFAFKGINNLPGIGKDILLGRFSNVKDRYVSFKNPEKDPFFTFDKIENILGDVKHKTPFFILYAKHPNRLDTNHKRSLKPFSTWLKTFSKTHKIGIHPSFFSHSGTKELTEEVLSLEMETGKKIKQSRQHFLSFSLPKTYRMLLQCGITEDYSMGYPEKTGYRASTGYSFLWYDLSEEKTTSLRLHPVQIMDVTMKKYHGWSVEKAIQKVENLKKNALKCDSPLRFIWHNSSFYKGFGWENWENVFTTMMKKNYEED
ncbi:MAG: hypothetical protein IPN79_09470 [Saprospiraceae bacterium]|nr:hypothetical protein [Saprospiraceae bacterium]